MIEDTTNDSQQAFYEAAWSKITLAKEHASKGWATVVPAPDFHKFTAWIAKRGITGKALDLGCGGGRYAIALAEQGLEVYGVDFAESAIKRAEENIRKAGLQDKVHMSVGNVLELPYEDAFFEIVNDDGCLHHIEPTDWPTYIANVTRVLKDKGILRIKVFSRNCTFFQDKVGVAGSKWVWLADSGYTHFFDEADIHGLFEPHFKILSLEENVHPKDASKKFFFVFMQLGSATR